MVNEFDQACRYTTKLDPAGFFRWLLGPLAGGLLFEEWLDTRTLPFPGEPDRTCDTVARFTHPRQAHRRVIWVADFQTEPDPLMLLRLLEYLARLLRERLHTPGAAERPWVGAALLNLTGPKQEDTLTLLGSALLPPVEAEEPPPPEAAELRWRIRQKTLSEEDAAETLTRIAAREHSRCLLPWVPLMQGGGEPAIIQRWKQLAEAEPNATRRADFGGLALVFAELTAHRRRWREALEGWNMRRSEQVMEWQAEAAARTEIRVRQADILRILEVRFRRRPSQKLAEAVQAQTDAAVLQEWLDLAVTADSLQAFRTAIRRPQRQQGNGANS
jgi:hypothetical protein